MIYAFSQLGRVLTVEHCRSAYFAYVQSLLQYGILAWGAGSASVLEPLAVTQRTIIKKILGKDQRYPSFLLFQNFPVLSIRKLFVKTLLIYIKTNKDKIFMETQHSYNTRNKINIGILTPKLNYKADQSNPFYVAHIAYSNIPNIIRQWEESSVGVYGRRVGRWLLEISDEAAEFLVRSRYRS
jgi:hypothetical protein